MWSAAWWITGAAEHQAGHVLVGLRLCSNGARATFVLRRDTQLFSSIGLGRAARAALSPTFPHRFGAARHQGGTEWLLDEHSGLTIDATRVTDTNADISMQWK
jgi:hypothetical protein